MPHLEPYYKDNFVFQASVPSTDDCSRHLQSGTSDELGMSNSSLRFHRKLAPVAESESSDVVAICLDRPFSDDVQVDITSSSSRDEGHLNLLTTESEVGTRSSEFKVSQVEQAVVVSVGDPQFAPRDSEVTFKPSTTGALLSASFDRPTRRSTLHQARSTCPNDRKKPLNRQQYSCIC